MFLSIEDLSFHYICVIARKKFLTRENQLFVDYLVECGQKSVLLNINSEEKIREFDVSYPGGVKCYVSKARDLLEKASRGVNPFDGWTPSIPHVENIEFNTKVFHELELEGSSEMEYCGFILVAGGLGERLGYNNIKVGLPVETFTNLSYLGFYIKKILAIEHRSTRSNCHLPFAIMTSENNHDLSIIVCNIMNRTVSYLQNNHYFGMPENQIYVMKQEAIPAIRTIKGELAVNESGHLIKKPHGHGDVHLCLYRDGVITDWINNYKLRHIFFFQDTNTVNFHTMPCVVAMSVRYNAHMVSTCVKRRPHEQTGGLCKLNNVNGDEMLCNVEYNQLEDVIINTIDPHGDVADETGYSPFPGNCNNLCIDINEYYHVITASKGIVPEFVNPKFRLGSKTEYLQPTRLESLMQDYPKLILQVSKQQPVNPTCLVVTLPRFMAWSPAKNDYVGAMNLKNRTGFEESPRSAESDLLELYRQQLLSINKCPICNPECNHHIIVEDGAHVVLYPESGCITDEIHSHIGRNVIIKKNSVLIVNCRYWFLENFVLDGCCVISDETSFISGEDCASIVIRDCSVVNKGWRYILIDKNDISYDIIYRMRGYIVKKEEKCEFSIIKKHSFVIHDKTVSGTCHEILQ